MPLCKMGRCCVAKILPSRRWPPTISELHKHFEGDWTAQIAQIDSPIVGGRSGSRSIVRAGSRSSMRFPRTMIVRWLFHGVLITMRSRFEQFGRSKSPQTISLVLSFVSRGQPFVSRAESGESETSPFCQRACPCETAKLTLANTVEFSLDGFGLPALFVLQKANE
jgi:hypothetical protein